MKKAALLITILTITVAAMAHQAAVREHNGLTPELAEFDPIQKPKGDELTE